MSSVESKSKLIAVVGPTGSGKTDLAVSLAKELRGELVNADSRQIYKEINIGTGKDVEQILKRSVKIHLLDITAPNETLTVASYQQLAFKVIDNIIAEDKVPILVGGTGLYIQAVTENLTIPEVPPQPKLRQKYEKLTAAELFSLLQENDPNTVSQIDKHNKRRLVRALEVSTITGKSMIKLKSKGQPKYNTLLLGITKPRAELYLAVNNRTERMFKLGLVDETKKLLSEYSPSSPALSGIGYAEAAAVVSGKMDLKDAIAKTQQRSRNYARRQLTWFRRNKRIKWTDSKEEAANLARKFLGQ